MQHPPDGVTKGIRFGCGAVFGLLIGLAIFLRTLAADMSIVALVSLIGLTGMACGYLAMHWGDAFWEWISDHLWWFG